MLKILMGLTLSFLACSQTAPAVLFHLRVVDESSGQTIPARVLLRSPDSLCRTPKGSILLKVGRDNWFITDGSSTVELPPGKTELRIERGKEYNRVKRWVEIPDKGTLELEVKLKRWINLQNLGYKSAEDHLHRSPQEIAAFCAAEDLNFGTVLQWWNRPQYGVPEGSGNIRNLAYGGLTIPTTVYDAEVEYEWGSLYLIGLPGPFPFLNDPAMPNLPAARYAREHGALICYQGWSRETILDALLGLVDVIDVCNNNFHLHRFQPRSQYSNLLNVQGFPTYPSTPEGMLQLNQETYYRLLNCGLRLAAGAGSATGAKENPVGFNRSYVRCAPGDGLKEMLENWRGGRNFVTNGPMLFLHGAGGLEPGSLLELRKPGKELELEIEAISDSPLQSVELVVNGEVISSLPIGTGQKKVSGKVTVSLQKSAWICARAIDRDDLLSDEELDFYNARPSQLSNRLRFAHTSPIYVSLAGRDVAVKHSIREGLAMIEAFEKFAREKAPLQQQKTIQDAIAQARGKLIAKLKEAE